MEEAKMLMLLASILGASIGVFWTSVINPLNNYFYFMTLFAIVGAGLANVILLILVKIYDWLLQ